MDLHPLPAAPRSGQALSHRSRRPARARAWGAMGTMLVATLAALSITLLGACGGGETGDEGASPGDAAPPAQAAVVDFTLESEYGPGDAPGATTRERAAAADAAAAVDVDVTLADRGNPAAVPVDRQAHTLRGRYVSRATAERNDAESAGHVVWVDASCCAGLDPELPERIAFGMQAVLGDEAPLYVSGNNLRQAARLADRLDALGLGRVYLVTP